MYLNTDLLWSTANSIGKLLTYSLGVDLSFERNARREFLIPYYGLDLGGLYLGSIGHVFVFNPFVGLHAVGDAERVHQPDRRLYLPDRATGRSRRLEVQGRRRFLALVGAP